MSGEVSEDTNSAITMETFREEITKLCKKKFKVIHAALKQMPSPTVLIVRARTEAATLDIEVPKCIEEYVEWVEGVPHSDKTTFDKKVARTINLTELETLEGIALILVANDTGFNDVLERLLAPEVITGLEDFFDLPESSNDPVDNGADGDHTMAEEEDVTEDRTNTAYDKMPTSTINLTLLAKKCPHSAVEAMISAPMLLATPSEAGGINLRSSREDGLLLIDYEFWAVFENHFYSTWSNHVGRRKYPAKYTGGPPFGVERGSICVMPAKHVGTFARDLLAMHLPYESPSFDLHVRLSKKAWRITVVPSAVDLHKARRDSVKYVAKAMINSRNCPSVRFWHETQNGDVPAPKFFKNKQKRESVYITLDGTIVDRYSYAVFLNPIKPAADEGYLFSQFALDRLKRSLTGSGRIKPKTVSRKRKAGEITPGTVQGSSGRKQPSPTNTGTVMEEEEGDSEVGRWDELSSDG